MPRVPAKSKAGRQAYQIGKPANPESLPEDVRAWNTNLELKKKAKQAMLKKFVPSTPAGTFLIHLARPTEEAAWQALLAETRHMPYGSIEALKKRGYTVDPL